MVFWSFIQFAFQQKIFGNNKDLHLHLVILFFESKDLRIDFSTSCFDLCMRP